ncbi:hypothetical protein Pelo_9162 [Pelomyxa schiedti]|nr:hypothetical protein Pelo_9162 [Pelomyxa schiedti]
MQRGRRLPHEGSSGGGCDDHSTEEDDFRSQVGDTPRRRASGNASHRGKGGERRGRDPLPSGRHHAATGAGGRLAVRGSRPGAPQRLGFEGPGRPAAAAAALGGHRGGSIGVDDRRIMGDGASEGADVDGAVGDYDEELSPGDCGGEQELEAELKSTKEDFDIYKEGGAEAEINIARHELSESLRENKAYIREIKKLKEDVRMLLDDKSRLTNENNSCKDTLEMMGKDMDDVKHKLKETTTTVCNQKARIEGNKDFKQQLQEKNQELLLCLSDLESVNKENTTLRQQLEEAVKDSSQLISELKQVKSRLVLAQENLEDEKNKSLALSQKNEKLRLQLQKTEKQLHEADRVNEQYVSDLDHKLEEYKVKLKSFTNFLRFYINSDQVKRNKYMQGYRTRVVAPLSMKFEQLCTKAAYQAKCAEYQALQKDFEELSVHLVDLEDQIQSTINSMKEEIANLKLELDDHRIKLMQSAINSARTSAQSSPRETNPNTVESSLQELQELLESTQQQLEDTQERNHQLQLELSSRPIAYAPQSTGQGILDENAKLKTFISDYLKSNVPYQELASAVSHLTKLLQHDQNVADQDHHQQQMALLNKLVNMADTQHNPTLERSKSNLPLGSVSRLNPHTTEENVRMQEQVSKLSSQIVQLQTQLKVSEEINRQKDSQLRELKHLLAGGESQSSPSKLRDSDSSLISLQSMYKAAQETISSLQQSITKKDEAVAKFQKMISSTRESHLAEKQGLELEVARLQDKLSQQANTVIQPQLTLECTPLSDEKVIPLEQAKKLSERQNSQISKLTQQLSEAEQEVGTLKAKIASTTPVVEKLTAELQLETEKAKLILELKAKQHLLHEKEAEIEKLHNMLSVEKAKALVVAAPPTPQRGNSHPGSPQNSSRVVVNRQAPGRS